MLTYQLNKDEGPIYQQLYSLIKEDIISGKLEKESKLPSKRAFARNCGVSTITVQNAYDQLISEGYITSVEKKGYYVSGVKKQIKQALVEFEYERPKLLDDLSNTNINVNNFPFSVWSHIMRRTMAEERNKLLSPISAAGMIELRKAIAKHLYSFRAMVVSPEQIIVGAGTEYLYSLIIQLLGRDNHFALEDPGYQKLSYIYKVNDSKFSYIKLDDIGLSITELNNSDANILHISPTHHFPTGLTMPLKRRYEVLSWAAERENRFIIEDDYDSEFKVSKNPYPTLFSLDGSEKVIYLNTFSRSLAPSIRISYMVLPKSLALKFNEKLSFYSSTVPSFEQLTLANFILEGYFEKHINRMRLYYMRQRKAVINEILNSKLNKITTIIENDSGLHFILRLNTEKSDEEIKGILNKENINISALSEYSRQKKVSHDFIISYSNLDINILKKALDVLSINLISWSN